MVVGYYVIRADADKLNTDYGVYTNTVRSMLEDMCSLIDNFHALSDSKLGGKAGESMKNYMAEVHTPLIQSMVTLVSQLQTDYASSYLFKYQDSAGGIYETSADDFGKYPTSGLGKVAKELKNIKQGSLSSADSELQAAQALIPDGMSFSFPSGAGVGEVLGNQAKKATKLKENVNEVEKAGYSLFHSGSESFENLRASVDAAITEWKQSGTSVETYALGSFGMVSAATGLRGYCNNARADQGGKQEQVIAVTKKSASNVKKANDREIKKQAGKKKFWTALGTVASVAVFMVSAAALVGSGGSALPLFLASMSFVTSGQDLISRSVQYGEVMNGNYQADKDKLSINSDITNSLKFVDKVNKTRDHYNESLDGRSFYRASKDMVVDGVGIEKFLGGQLIDKGFDYWKSSVDGEGTKAAIGVTQQLTSALYTEGFDSYIAGDLYDKLGMHSGRPTINGAGTDIAHLGLVSTAGKSVEIVADYQVGQIDEKLDALDAENSQLDQLNETFESSWDTSAVKW